MQRTLLNTAVAFALAGSSLAASAQFSGAYDPANWTVTHSPDAVIDTGTVDWTTAPLSITLIGSDNSARDIITGDCNSGSCAQSQLRFSIVATRSGVYSFDWAYASQDATSPEWDPAGYLVGGGRYQLSDDAGASAQGGGPLGHVSFSAVQGTEIAFFVDTLDNTNGAASLTISNFSAPVPEPATLGLMFAGLAGLAWRCRRKVAV